MRKTQSTAQYAKMAAYRRPLLERSIRGTRPLKSHRLLGSVECYDPEQDWWHVIQGHLCCPRMAAAAAVTKQGSVVIAGGATRADRASKKVYLTSDVCMLHLPDLTKSMEGSGVPCPKLPSARLGASAAMLSDGSFLLVGGMTATEPNGDFRSVDEVLLLKRPGEDSTWTTLDNLPTRRHAMLTVVVADPGLGFHIDSTNMADQPGIRMETNQLDAETSHDDSATETSMDELIEEGNAPNDAESLDADFKTVSSRKSFKRKKGRQNGNSSNSTDDTILSQSQRQTGLTVMITLSSALNAEALAIAQRCVVVLQGAANVQAKATPRNNAKKTLSAQTAEKHILSHPQNWNTPPRKTSLVIVMSNKLRKPRRYLALHVVQTNLQQLHRAALLRHRQQQFYKSQQLPVAPLLRKRTQQRYKGNQDKARENLLNIQIPCQTTEV
ncbi:hypothetical protein ISCGN_019703 [Ixodes scapularis]